MFNKYNQVTTASKGEDRDEAVEMILTARTSLYEALDALNEAKIFIERTLSKTLSEKLNDDVIERIDGEDQNIMFALRQIEKMLVKAKVSYEEE